MGLLAAEMTAHTGMDPARFYAKATEDLGTSHYARIDALASGLQRERLAALGPADITARQLAGDQTIAAVDRAPGNGEPLGGIKVSAQDCWFAVRPSGTENAYKLYAESFRDEAQLTAVQDEARQLIADFFSRS